MKKFIKSAFFISAGAALPMVASFVLLIPYTDNLTTSHYGELAIYIAFAMLIQIVMNYGIDTYLSVHYYDHEDPIALKSFLSEITGVILIIGGLLTLFFLVAGHFLFLLLFPDEGANENLIRFFPYGLMSVLTGFFNAFYRTYVNLQIFGDKPLKYFWFALFNFVVTVVISTIGVYMSPLSIVGPMWGRLLSGILIFLLSVIFIFREYGVKFSMKLIPQLRDYCTPVVVFTLLTWVIGYINIFILKWLATPSDVGVYDFAMKCTLIIEFAAIGLLSTINPLIYKLWKNNQLTESTGEENRYHHVFSMANMLIIALNLFILPYMIYLFVSNEGYYESIKYLPVLLLSFTFRGLYNVFTNPIYFFKKTGLLPRIFGYTAILQIVLGILMIRYFGIAGAVWSYFIVKLIQILFLWFKSRNLFTFRFNRVKMILMPSIYCTIIILLFELTDLALLIKNLIQIALAAILILIVYRHEIRELPRMFKNRNSPV